MDYLYLYLAIGFAVLFFFIGWYMRIKGRQELLSEQKQPTGGTAAVPATAVPASSNPEIRRLQLQAYERLIILCERLALPSLLGRFPLQELTVAQLRDQLVQTIKAEFEYNLSQQIYVSSRAWDGIKNLKEQHLFIVQQVAGMLPTDAPGTALGKKIGELLTHEAHTDLQPIVAGLLNQEARQLMLG
ncbi:MAG TPA: hypothetical protein PKE07_03695 [Lacibacter sp.]|nr:hypothetical protein [Lacibacter sp.]HMO89728.1 hypothetical protein [Lacibacter sp.]